MTFDARVLAGGLATTALAFLGVYWLSDWNLMGWYLDYVIPIGALMVGWVASLGYSASAYLLHRKMSGRLLATVLGLLAASYFAAHYVEYRLHGGADGFWRAFDESTRGFAWDHVGRRGEPLEELGYGLRLLELIGFVGGGLVVPLALRKRPYCDACSRYRISKIVAIVPGGETDAHGRVQRIVEAASSGDFQLTAQAIITHGPLAQRRAIEDVLPQWISLDLVYCGSCADGGLARRVHRRPPQRPKLIELGTTPLARPLMKEFLKRAQ